MRVDIISDTHGYLSDELLQALKGADLIVHAGDICSTDDFYRLEMIAPVKACIGNNDWGDEYGPAVKRRTVFMYEGLKWQVCHYRRELNLLKSDIAIFGHTHVPFMERDEWTGCFVINPGSPTYPRAGSKPSIARLEVEAGTILSASKIELI